MVGDRTAQNIAIDNDEIMARNNGRQSTLCLNIDGGDVRMGEHEIKPALAYGSIRENGPAINRLGEGHYRIHIAGGARIGDVVLTMASNTVAVIVADVEGGQYEFFAAGNNSGNAIDTRFDFVVYGP